MYDVSVIIATYNMSAYVEEAIDSCLNSLRNCQIVIVDDGSTDNTHQILKERYSAKNNVVLHRFPENQGKVAAFNKAYSLSSGCVVTLLGADDHILPGRQNAVDKILEEKDLDLVVGAYLVADEKMNIKRRVVVNVKRWSSILKKNHYPGGVMVLSRRFSNDIFPIPTDINNEDYLVSLCASYNGKVASVEDDVLVYRRHSNNTWSRYSKAEAMKKNAARAKAILKVFQEKVNLKNNKEKRKLDLAINVKDRISEKSFIRSFCLLPSMIAHGYSLSIISRVLLGPDLYFRIKFFLRKDGN